MTSSPLRSLAGALHSGTKPSPLVCAVTHYPLRATPLATRRSLCASAPRLPDTPADR